MRKLFIFLGIMILSLVLVACNVTKTEVTPPTYTGILVENTIPVDETEFVTFYRTKQDTVLIEVSIVNPDALTIKSVVVNGITYNSHRFSEESTNTVVSFEMNVGNIVGSTTYSIDRISYLNGENTFTIENFNNNLFEVFVYKDTPTVERENYDLDRDSIIIDFDITDDDDVIITDSLIAKLYSGETLVKEELLVKGLATVNFSGLLANKQYEVKVEASYDLLDGNGIIADYVLYSGTYSTDSNGLPSAAIVNTTISSNSVSFSVDFTDTDSVIAIGSLQAIIFKGEERLTDAEYTKVISGSTGGLSFSNLLNDVEYTIKVIANYDMSDGSGTQVNNVLAVYTLNTLPREVPTPELTNMNILENSIDFGINIDDLFGIIDKDTLIANLYIDDEFIISSNVSELYFGYNITNLFSSKSFRIELLADYDLNDDNGIHVNQVIFNETFNTLENFLPSVVILDMIDTQGYLTVNLSVSDVHETLIGSLWAILYEENQIVKTIYFDRNETVLVFDYATVSGTNYYLEIYADYNLRDGNGAKLNQLLSPAVLLSIEPKAPIAEISDVITTATTISLTVDVIDADNTIDTGSTTVYLYLADSIIPVQTIVLNPNDNTIVFDSLDILSNNEYTIIVESDYDLDDGSGLLLQQTIATTTVITKAKVLPEFDFTLRETTHDSITFDLLIDDSNDVLIPTNTVYAVLMLNNAPAVGVASINLDNPVNSLILFDNLYSNQGYTIDFVAVYDLNDGSYDGSSQVLYSTGELVTDSYVKPTANNVTMTTTINSIILTVSIEDIDDVIDSNLEAVVYLGTTIITSKPLMELLDQTITLAGLDSETEYMVKIEANYDLKESSGLVVDGLLFKKEVETLPLTPPTIKITNSVPTTNSFTVDISLNNSAGTIIGDRYARLYKDGVYDNQEVEIFDDTNLSVEFGSLLSLNSDSVYEVRVFASYDLNDLDGVHTEMLGNMSVTTLAKTVPSITISNVFITHDSITFEYVLVDAYGVLLNDEVSAVLTVDGTEVTKVLLTNTVSFGLSGFLASQDFEIKITGDYNLNSGAGDQLDKALDTLEFTTASYQVPSATFNEVIVNQTNVTVDVTVTDNDSTAVGVIIAELYDDTSVLPIETISTLVIGENYLVFNEILDYGRMYSVVITTSYDLLDGNHVHPNQMLREYVIEVNNRKLPQAVISSVIIGQDSITFDVDIEDNDTVIIAGTIQVVIYSNGLPIQSIPLLGLSSIAVTNLIPLDSNKLYEIRIETSYDNGDGNLTQENYVTATETFTTVAKQIPTAVISIDSSTVDEIQFDVDIDNPDDVATVRKAYLYNEDDIQVGTAIDLPNTNSNNINKLFSSLLSDHNYTIMVKITYDLDDGNGLVTITAETIVQATLAKSTPTANIIDGDYTATINSLTVTYDYNDVDAVGTTYMRVYAGSVVVTEVQLVTNGTALTEIFTGLDSNTEYIIKLETSYDLNDLDGVQTATLATTIANTVALSAPTATISNPVITTESLTVDIFLDNSDGTITGNRFAGLYLAGVLVPGTQVTLLDNENTFAPVANLLSNTEYEVRVTVDYDINGPHNGEILNSYNITTAAKAVPSITISNVVITHDAITFDYILVDVNNVLIDDDIEAVLIVEGNRVSKILLTNSVSFGLSGFLASQAFEIEFIGNYNLNDGVGDQLNKALATFEYTTASYAAPSAVINDVVVNQTTVTVDVTVTDDDSTVIGSISAVLYDDTSVLPIATLTGLSIGVNNLVFNETLDYGKMYSIVIVTDYDLRDGELVHPAEMLTEFVVEVNSKKLPEAVVSNLIVGQDVIDFAVTIYDNDLSLEAATTFAVLYLNGNPVLGQSISLPGLSHPALQFNGLLSDNEYEIRIVTSYDRADGNGIRTNYEMTVTVSTTDAKQVPSAELHIDFSTAALIQFDVVIDDPNIIATLSEAYFYDEDGNQIGAVIPLPSLININKTNSIPLLSDEPYTIIVKITYDLNDGNGTVVREVESKTISTIANVAPSGLITEVTSTTDKVTIIYNYKDTDSIATTYLNIYDDVTFVKGILVTITGEDLVGVIDGLDPFVNYTVKLETTYDLNDLNGVQTELLNEMEIATLSFVIIDLTSEILDSESNTLVVTIDDIDDILVDATFIVATISQYDSDTFSSYMLPIGTTTLELFNLLSDNTYTLELSATYNSDGTPETNVVYSYTFDTPARTLPEVTIAATPEWVSTSGPDTVSIDITIGADTLDYVTDTTWIAYIYDDMGIELDSIDLFTLNGSLSPEETTQTVVFSNASLNNLGSYSIVVRAETDINIYDSLDVNSGPQVTIIAQRVVVNAEN